MLLLLKLMEGSSFFSFYFRDWSLSSQQLGSESGHADTNQLQTCLLNIICSNFHYLSAFLIQCDNVDTCSLPLTYHFDSHTYSSICCCPSLCTLQSSSRGKGIGKVS